MDLQSLIANLAGPVRRTTLNGREHLVAPLRMIVPGVLAGSKGPLYYPPEEIARDYTAWNHMPIVVYHPTKDGHAISARDPDVLNKQCIGTVLNSRINNGMLDADGYFDIARTRHIRAEILTKLESGKPIELSTGLFTDNQPAHNGATHKGKQYTYIARNYRPDHLAILPDKVGACSIKDGCGVLVNEDKEERTHTATDFAKSSVGVAGIALGIERTKVIPDALKRVGLEKADAKSIWKSKLPAKFEFKPFDIILAATPEELTPLRSKNSPLQPSNLANIVAGPRDKHAFMLVPDKSGVLRIVTVGGGGSGGSTTIVSGSPNIVAGIKSLPKEFSWQDIKNTPERFSRKKETLKKLADRLQPVADVAERIQSLPPASMIHESSGSFRVMRTKVPLTEVEKSSVMKRLGSIMGGVYPKEEHLIAGVKNYLFGAGKATITSPPSNCAGGICSVFAGVRDLGSPSAAIPQTLRSSPHLVEAANILSKGSHASPVASKAVISGVAKTSALRALGGRVALATIPIAIGSYFLTKGLAGSHKTSGGNCGTGSGGFQEGNTCAHNDYTELADNWGNEELSANCLNGLSYEQLKTKLQNLLDQIDLPLALSDEEKATLTVVDIYDDYVLYTDGQDGYVQEYENKDGSVTLIGEPEPVLDEEEGDEGIALDQNIDIEPSVNANPNHDELGRFAQAASHAAFETGSRARYSQEHLEAGHTHSHAAKAHADAAEVSQDEQHVYHRAKTHKHATLADKHYTASTKSRQHGDVVRRIAPIVGGLAGGYIGSQTGADKALEGVNSGAKVGGTVGEAINKIVARKKVKQYIGNESFEDTEEFSEGELLLLEELGLGTTTEVTPDYIIENMGGKNDEPTIEHPGSGPPPKYGSDRYYALGFGTKAEQDYWKPLYEQRIATKQSAKSGFMKSLGLGSSGLLAPKQEEVKLANHDKLSMMADLASAKANASGSVIEHAQAAALHTHASLSKTAASIAAARAARHHAKSIVKHAKAAKDQATSWFTGQAYGAGTEENPDASGTSPVSWPGKGGMSSEDPSHPMGAWTSAGKDIAGKYAGGKGWTSAVPASGDNCGTGAGGFKAGNTCATNEEGEEVNSYNEGVEEMALNAETRGKMVKKLVTNCKCSGRKDCPDEAALNEESDASLLELTVNAFCEGDDEGDAEDTAEAGKEEPMDKKKGMPFGKKPMMNEQEWLATAPPSIRSVVQNAMDFEKKQKDTLVAQITANASNVFTKEHLATFDIQQLQGIAALATNTKVKQAKVEEKAPLYLGAAGGPIASTVTNEGFDKEDLDMIPPTINYAEEAKARRQLAGVN